MDKHNFQAVTTEQVQTLSKLKETLALSAHILVRNPGQLASQMTGRLIGDTTTPVQSLLACALQKNGPWLRPVTACLEKPGDARYRTFSGHTSVVTSLAVSADSKLVFSASADRTIRVWDINLGSEIAILQGFPCSVESLALTPEGDRILAGLFDGSIRVIRWRTASTIARLEGHNKAVTAISCTPDGHTAVSSSQDSNLVIWDLGKFKQLAILRGHKGPVNDVVIPHQGDIAISASSDKTLRVWDLKHRREVGKMEAPWEQLSLDVSPKGNLLISGSDRVPIAWDLARREQIAILTSFYGPYHESSVDDIAIAPNGYQFISASSDNSIKVWNLNESDLGQSEPITTWATHQAGVSAVVITPNGRWAVSASYDHDIKVWKLEDPESVTKTAKSTPTGNPIKWIGFSPREEVISLAVGYKQDQFGEDPEWESRLKLEGSQIDWYYRVRDIALSKNRQTVLVAVGNGIEVIDIPSQKRAPEGLFGIRQRLVLSEDDRLAASYNWTKNQLEVWERSSGTMLLTIPNMRDVEALAITTGNRWVVAGTKAGDIFAWRLSDMQKVDHPKAHAGRVNWILAESSGGIVSCGEDGTIKAWSFDDASLRFSLALPWKKTHNLILNEDERLLIAVSDAGAAMIWDIEDRRLIRSLDDGSVKVHGVWNTDIPGKPLSNLALMAQRKWLVINSGMTTSVLDLVTGKHITSFSGDTEVETISVSPDESSIAVGTVLGETYQLLVWPKNIPWEIEKNGR